jgi:hypothetical protein
MSHIDFVVRVEIGRDGDFERKKMEKAVSEFAEQNLGATSWEYKTFSALRDEKDRTYQEIPDYPDDYKNIFCETCKSTTTHISEHGNNFKCLRCEAQEIRKIIAFEPAL